jgi:hypothetical protein
MKKYKEVTEARRFGEITRMGNAKKNENDKWSRWESEEMRKNRTKRSRKRDGENVEVCLEDSIREMERRDCV